jgi:RimJ/RimL family protein N-acetyltransferase
MRIRAFSSSSDLGVVTGWRDAAAEPFIGSGWPASVLRRDFSYMGVPRPVGYIGLVDGVPVGLVVFYFVDNREAQLTMMVAPHARRGGCGHALLAQAIRSPGLKCCTADVDPSNIASARCLLRAGFTERFSPEYTDRFFMWGERDAE